MGPETGFAPFGFGFGFGGGGFTSVFGFGGAGFVVEAEGFGEGDVEGEGDAEVEGDVLGEGGIQAGADELGGFNAIGDLLASLPEPAAALLPSAPADPPLPSATSEPMTSAATAAATPPMKEGRWNRLGCSYSSSDCDCDFFRLESPIRTAGRTLGGFDSAGFGGEGLDSADFGAGVW